MQLHATLRPPNAADRSRVTEILRATGAFAPDEVAVALELFDTAVDDAATRPAAASLDYELVGAYTADGRLDGYACFGATSGTDRAYDLYWIAVDPHAHGGGVGSALLRAVEARLSERRARLLMVETSSRSEYGTARAFYRRRGFREVARVRDFYAPGDDRIVLTKRLQHAPQARGAVAS